MAKRKRTTKKPELVEVKTHCDLGNEALKKAGYNFELDRPKFEVLMLVMGLPKSSKELTQLNNLYTELFNRTLGVATIAKYDQVCAKTKNNIVSQIKKDLLKVLTIVKPYADENHSE